jgi:hypothetical protein
MTDEEFQLALNTEMVFHGVPYAFREECANRLAKGQAAQELLSEAVSQLDGITEIIEIYEPVTPSQKRWKKNWLTDTAKIISDYQKKVEGK